MLGTLMHDKLWVTTFPVLMQWLLIELWENLKLSFSNNTINFDFHWGGNFHWVQFFPKPGSAHALILPKILKMKSKFIYYCLLLLVCFVMTAASFPKVL